MSAGIRLVSPRGCFLKDVPLAGAYPSHLYVTPLDERARTLCLFFLGPWPADSSSLEPLDLERDLYTVAIISVGVKAGLETEPRVEMSMAGLNLLCLVAFRFGCQPKFLAGAYR